MGFRSINFNAKFGGRSGDLAFSFQRDRTGAFVHAMAVSELVQAEPLERHFSTPHQGQGQRNFWVCGCKRRHRVANVVRSDYACPFCHERYSA